MSSLIAKYHGSAESPNLDLSMKLFVGQVPKNMEEGELQPYFDKYGPIVSIKICRDRDTKQHKGCAFVTFENLDHADDALHEMHDRVALPGAKKEMQIKPVHNEDEKKFEKRLFVGMISKSLSAPELEDMFSKFGEISDCNILFSPDKTSRGCGFIKFEKASSCLIAIKEVHHSQTMDGCNSPIVVKHADSPADKMKRQAGPGFDDRQSKRSFVQPAPFQHAPPPQPQYNQPPQPPSQPNATAMALINAFTPLLATVAEQNNPGTTKMLVKSIEIALSALQHENSPAAHTALVSIASNLSVAVANNLSRPQTQNAVYNQSYNSAADYSQYSSQDYQQYNSQYANQAGSYSSSSSYYGNAQPSGNTHHYNYSSRAN